MLITNVSLVCGQHIFQEGFELLEQEQYESAATFFETAIAKYPDDKTAHICYARAIGLSGEYRAGLQYFENLLTKYVDDYEVGLNYAEALLWNQENQLAESYYKSLIEKDSTNFVANYGYANALAANKKYKQALEYNQKALDIKPTDGQSMFARKHILLGHAYNYFLDREYAHASAWVDSVIVLFPDEPKAYELKNLINAQKQSDIDTEVFYTEDDFGNNSRGYLVAAHVPISQRFLFKATLFQNDLRSKSENTEAIQKEANLRLKWYISRKIEAEAGGGMNIINIPNQSFDMNGLGYMSLSYRPSDRYYINARLHNQTYNYTTDLLRHKIQVYNGTISQHYVTKSSLGFYGQFTHSQVNDGNKGNNVYASIYYDFKLHPLKAGVNFNYISFSDNRGALYFSPEEYMSATLFLGLDNFHLNQKLKYRIIATGGMQKEGLGTWRRSHRYEIKLQYPVHRYLQLGLSHSTSNVAPNIISGAFRYSTYRVNLTYVIH